MAAASERCPGTVGHPSGGDRMTDLRLLAWCVVCGAVVVAGGLGMAPCGAYPPGQSRSG